MKKYVCTCAVLVLALALAGCGASKGQPASSTSPGGETESSKTYAELRWGMPTFAGPIYWSDNLYFQVAAVTGLVAQNMMEYEQDGKVVRGPLVSSVEHPDATTYIYDLKSGIRFSDGKPVTAADAVFSLDHNLNGKASEVKAFWEDVASISQRGNSTVIVKLKHPSVIWPQIMAFTSQVIEKAAAERAGEKNVGTPSGLPVGSGPWKIDSYSPEASVSLSADPYWKGQQRPARKINITIFSNEATMALALRSGAIDGVFFARDEKLFKGIPGARQLTGPGIVMTWYGMNVNTPPLNDVHVRRAIAYATDVKGMIDAQYPGVATEDVTFGPTDLFYSGLGSKSEVNKMLGGLPKYEYNLTAARRELARSAYPHGFPLTVQATATETSQVANAQVLVADLSKIGIKAKLDELSASQTATLHGKEVTLFFNEYSAVYPNAYLVPSYLLPSSQIPTYFNVAGYKNSEVDQVFARLPEMLDSSARLRMLGKALKVAGEEVPYRPLFTYDSWMTLSAKYVFPTFSPWTVMFTPWAMNVKLAH